MRGPWTGIVCNGAYKTKTTYMWVQPAPSRGFCRYEGSLDKCKRVRFVFPSQTLSFFAPFCAVLLCALLCCFWLRPEPVYFGMSRDMKLLPMTPLSEPILNEAALKNWVSEAVTMSFNLDYLNWKRQLNEARAHYTRKAFVGFALSLDREGHLPLLRQQRALMHAVIQGTPVLTRSGVVQGTLVWEFELPLLVSYETSAGRISNNAVTVVAQVQRVPATDYPMGVAISSLVTTRRQSIQ